MTATFTTPIIMSTPMVRSLLDDRKTQTRRLVTSQWANLKMHFDQGERCFVWVRESVRVTRRGNEGEPMAEPPVLYLADDAPQNDVRADYPFVRPSIHMPRWASRLTLEVTDVRLQRLQDIDEADAMAEGDPNQGLIASENTHRDWYQALWESLHGKGSWEKNPDVVAISFRVHRQNIDALLADRGVI